LGIQHYECGISFNIEFLRQLDTLSLFGIEFIEHHAFQRRLNIAVFVRRTSEPLAGTSPLCKEINQKRFIVLNRHRFRLSETAGRLNGVGERSGERYDQD
jgi:hypothetical protein